MGQQRPRRGRSDGDGGARRGGSAGQLGGSAFPLRITATLAALLIAGAAAAAELPPGFAAEVRRAIAAVGSFGTEVPAVRREREAREPSAGYLLGAALGAWTNAAAQLAFDLKNPQAAGPAHAHLDQDGDDLLRQECREEITAFEALESRSAEGRLAPQEVAAMANMDAKAWLARKASGPPAACK